MGLASTCFYSSFTYSPLKSLGIVLSGALASICTLLGDAKYRQDSAEIVEHLPPVHLSCLQAEGSNVDSPTNPRTWPLDEVSEIKRPCLDRVGGVDFRPCAGCAYLGSSIVIALAYTANARLLQPTPPVSTLHAEPCSSSSWALRHVHVGHFEVLTI
ncbi:hypothetical protein BV22DRAFT_1056446 [Leucogyrophana mollusca]|uniref:Uncharacterized protein n=1 Tax=Leucogyrophana mollusca TaxID=85980 RepID=A0ACB8BXL7_9AGAM|nr:hypothetical protein BV22DRAFT_1056446 [Leucogyrophana mollusca]